MPITRLLVVGDAHAGSPHAPPLEALLAFLADAPALADGLVLNGDLFEFSFGYRHTVPRRAVPLLAMLGALRERMAITVVGGNHDRWGEPCWGDVPGVAFAPRECRLAVGGRPVRVLHGDNLDEGGAARRLLHAAVGSRLASAVYAALPPGLALPLVERVSARHGLATATEARKQDLAARQAAWARRVLRDEAPGTVLVLGHSHGAALEADAQQRVYVNPGAWCTTRGYVVVTADAVTPATARA